MGVRSNVPERTEAAGSPEAPDAEPEPAVVRPTPPPLPPELEGAPYETLLERGLELAEGGRLALAADVLERAALLRDDDPDVHYGLGVIYGLRAIEALARADGSIFRNRAAEAVAIDRAIFAYERALHVDARHLPSLSNLAALYALKGDRERSIATLKQSLKLDPDQPDLRERLEELGAF